MVRFLFSGFSWSRAPSEAVPSQGAAGLPAHRCAVGATRRRASVTVHSQRLGRAFSHEEAGEHDPVVPLLLPESASRRVRVHHVKPVPKGVHHPRWVPADPEVVHQRGAPRSCRARTHARRERGRRPTPPPPTRSGNFSRRCEPSRVADRAAFPVSVSRHRPARRAAHRRSSGRSRTTSTSSARSISRARSRRMPRSTRGASARRTT